MTTTWRAPPRTMSSDSDWHGDSPSSEDSDRMYIASTSPLPPAKNRRQTIPKNILKSVMPRIVNQKPVKRVNDPDEANQIPSKSKQEIPKRQVRSGKPISSPNVVGKPLQPSPSPKLQGRKAVKRRSEISDPHKTKKRRTRGYRDSLISTRGKKNTFISKGKDGSVEPEIDLDAEIDRVLEEKAIKNNLTATNVKSIIRQVITNNMVQKMMMSTLRRERSLNAAAAGNSGAKDGNVSGAEEEDEFLDFEPKLTRAKIKELLETQTSPCQTSTLWPISPMKLLKAQPPSEAHMLIASHDLPEDSEYEDEEYVPTAQDLLIHSEDESSNFTSFTSDLGSPQTPRPELSVVPSIVSALRNRRGQPQRLDMETESPATLQDAVVFKTPPAPKRFEKRVDCAIGLRTRSRLPLNDTPLEDLEKQLIPPDITTDMYDFGKGESDNEDYLEFLKDFATTGSKSKLVDGNDDEEEAADPEYNVMEDEEDAHDKEEHRVDRAVKVTKKELNELVAELFDEFDEYHFTSADEIEDFSTLKQQLPFELRNVGSQIGPSSENPTLVITESVPSRPESCASTALTSIAPGVQETLATSEAQPPENNECITRGIPMIVEQPDSLFSFAQMETLRHQMSQHVQLLAQSFLFHTFNPKEEEQKVAFTARSMIIELSNMSNQPECWPTLSICNLGAAVQILTCYPKRKPATPIKKKILEEKYMNDLCEHTALSFPGWVVHLVCKSPAFMYPSLLPSFYKESGNRFVGQFTRGEDGLIAHGLDSLPNRSMFKAAEIISRVLLPIRTAEQVFYRIRNAKLVRKTTANQDSQLVSPLKYYIQNKELQPAPHIPGVFTEPIPPNLQPVKNLPKVWQEIIQTMETGRQPLMYIANTENISKVKAMRKLKRRRKPVDTREVVQGLGKKLDGLPISYVKPRRKCDDSKSENVIMKSFPMHHDCLSTIDNKNSRVVPICNYSGKPEAYFIIPKSADPVIIEEFVATADCPSINMDGNTGAVEYEYRIPFSETVRKSYTPRKKSQLTREDHSARTWVYDKKRRAVESTKQIQIPEDDSLLISVDMTDNEEEESVDEDDNRFLDSEAVSDSPTEESSGDDGHGPESVDLCHSTADEDGEPDQACDGDGKPSSGGGYNKSSGGSEEQNNQSTQGGGSGGCDSSGAGISQSGSGGDRGGNDRDEDKDKRKRFFSGSGKGTKRTDVPEEEADKKQKVKASTNSPSPPRNSASGKCDSTPGSSKSVFVGDRKKRSPVHTGKLKRTSKYNTGTEEALLEEVELGQGSGEHSEAAVKDACMDTFLLRLQSRIEVDGRNPGLYHNVMQAICEFNSRLESARSLFLKIEDLLKDYPDLVKQFAGFISPEDAIKTGRFIDHQQSVSELHFMDLLEKWTQDCPQLKARIMQKYTTFREEENLTEERIVNVMEPFFAQNQVMMDAFKAMFSFIYRPQSNSTDFEVLDLEMDEKEPSSGGDQNVEVVKLPEESFVPATHTCPCSCHSGSTSSAPFITRIKHCHKCCLKFQDGKVFVHNGRIMKPVNVEFTTSGVARDIQTGLTCISCLKPTTAGSSPSSTTPSTSLIVPPTSPKPWTREEDFLLLTVYQAEADMASTVDRLASRELPSRSIDEIRNRFKELTTVLQEMTRRQNPSSSNSSAGAT